MMTSQNSVLWCPFYFCFTGIYVVIHKTKEAKVHDQKLYYTKIIEPNTHPKFEFVDLPTVLTWFTQLVCLKILGARVYFLFGDPSRCMGLKKLTRTLVTLLSVGLLVKCPRHTSFLVLTSPMKVEVTAKAP